MRRPVIVRSSLLHQIRNTYTQIHSGLTTKKWGQNIFVSNVLFFESDGQTFGV